MGDTLRRYEMPERLRKVYEASLEGPLSIEVGDDSEQFPDYANVRMNFAGQELDSLVLKGMVSEYDGLDLAETTIRIQGGAADAMPVDLSKAGYQGARLMWKKDGNTHGLGAYFKKESLEQFSKKG